MAARLGLNGRNVADGLEEAPVVEPVHPFQGGELDGLQGAVRDTRQPPMRRAKGSMTTAT